MLTYPEYKNSGIAWVGDIPVDWSIVPAKHVFTEIRDKNSDGSETNALQFKFGEIISKKNFDARTDEYVSDKIVSYTVVEPNTIMINGLNLNYDLKSLRVAIVKEKGVITSAYLALKPNELKIVPQFANYLLKGYEARMAFHNMGSGVRLTLGFKEFKNQPIIMPGLKEQEAIVKYLNNKTKEIDALVTEARASIEEYKQWKESIIYEAVTKGLDLDAELVDSGVEWIGKVPNGVKMSRVGMHHEITLGKMLCPDSLGPDYTLEPYYCAANVHFDGITGDLKKMWFSQIEKDRYLIKKGDLLVVEGGAGAGGCAIANEQTVPTYIQNSILRVVPKFNHDVRYLRYLIECLVKKGYVDFVCNKATIPHFTKEKLAYVPYPVFENDVQTLISDYLDERCSSIDALIKEKEALIADLEKYKKSLIFEVVTGKRRVV